jgi:hypothetical protein
MRTVCPLSTIEQTESRPSERRFDVDWHMDGWDWLWATFMMGVWVILLGVVVFLAIKLAQGDRQGKSRS